MAALWSGQKPADMSGSTTSPSVQEETRQISTHTYGESEPLGYTMKQLPQACVLVGLSINRTEPIVLLWLRCQLVEFAVIVSQWKCWKAANQLRNKNQPFDSSFGLISIISGMTARTGTWLSGTLATQRVIILTMAHWIVQVQEEQIFFGMITREKIAYLSQD